MHPSGEFLYGSNRGHDSITVFRIDQSTGKLTTVEREPTQGKTPRNFRMDPTGKYLFAANQQSDSVVENIAAFSGLARAQSGTPVLALNVPDDDAPS